MCSLRSAGLCVVAGLTLLATAPTWAAEPITGKLTGPGYTLIAVSADGKASSVVAGDGSFSLVPPADTVTVHLRAPDGRYGGPVVLRDDGGKVARARVKVTAAKRAVTKAKRAVRKAKRAVRRALGKRSRRAAMRRWRRARRRLSKTNNQLRAANGRLAQALKEEVDSTNRAVLGVKAGAALGDVEVNATAGYAVARLPESVSKSAVDPTRTARAANGVPVGAGNFGFVAVPAGAGVPGDADGDGVADPLDIDRDGDLILNDFERSQTAQTAHAAQVPEVASVYSGLLLRIEETVNANAAALSTAQIDSALATHAHLGFLFPQDAPTELDCGGQPDPGNADGWIGGLSYCTKSGTGHWLYTGGPGAAPPAFPACCDSDADGFGTLARSDGLEYFYLGPGARSDQIGSGDVVIERVTRDGVETPTPISLQFVFATVPALVSYSDTAGHQGTVSYPVPPGGTGSPGGPGITGYGFPVAPGPDGHIVLTFTLWRPQRRPILPDANGLGGDACLAESPPCAWVDIGGLHYAVPHIWKVSRLPQQVGPMYCPQSTYSTSDSNLAPLTQTQQSPETGFQDLAADRRASPANTITFTLDATQCLASAGFTWDQDEELDFHFWASLQADKAEQNAIFTRR